MTACLLAIEFLDQDIRLIGCGVVQRYAFLALDAHALFEQSFHSARHGFAAFLDPGQPFFLRDARCSDGDVAEGEGFEVVFASGIAGLVGHGVVAFWPVVLRGSLGQV